MAKPTNKPVEAKKIVAAAQTKAVPQPAKEIFFVMGTTNYIIMAVGVALILLGYFIMIGGGNDPNNPGVTDVAAKYSFVRITLSPAIIIAGLCIEAIAIMYKTKN